MKPQRDAADGDESTFLRLVGTFSRNPRDVAERYITETNTSQAGLSIQIAVLHQSSVNPRLSSTGT
jgi:hypothetical protein